jgi:predicted metal-dependent hydrolase
MQHNITLPNGEFLQYQLERRARRTVGLKITSNGLVIHAPSRLLKSQLEAIILEKSGWIQAKLSALRAHQLPTFAWKNGETMWLLGQEYTLALVEDKRTSISLMNNTLQLTTPHIHDEKWVARKVFTWYQQTARADFARRLEIFAAKLGEKTPQLFLSNAKTRWGSCNSKREIRLNWRLIQAPPALINYVVCHELAHLKEMNHSKKFWLVVEGLFPDYIAAEKSLKQLSPQLHRI